MSPDTSRRALLGAIGAAAAGASAGCLDAVGIDAGGSETLRLQSAVTEGDLPEGSVPLVPDGRVVLVNFFATWCPHCDNEMPALRKARAEYGADELYMVSVTPEAGDDVIRAFWDQHDATWPVVKDPDLEAMTKYEVDGYPTNLLFERDDEPTREDASLISAQSFETITWAIDSLGE